LSHSHSVPVACRMAKGSLKCPALPTGLCGDALACCRQLVRTAAVRTCQGLLQLC